MKRFLYFLVLLLPTALAGELQQLHQAQKPETTSAPAKTEQSSPIPGATLFPGVAPTTPTKQHDITEIGLERTRCYAGCPAYTVIIGADGSFRYTGEYGVERLGEYTGQVSQGRLNQVLALISETEFEDFQTSYLSPFLDGPTVYTMVKTGGETKVVENYANNGPATLWAIEQLIDDLLETAEWNEGGADR